MWVEADAVGESRGWRKEESEKVREEERFLERKKNIESCSVLKFIPHTCKQSTEELLPDLSDHKNESISKAFFF